MTQALSNRAPCDPGAEKRHSGIPAVQTSIFCDERGVTAVEFAMVGPVFLAMMFGIISVGFYFFTTFTLENAVEDAARFIRTGQIQTVSNTGTSGSPNYSYPSSMTSGGVCTTSMSLDTCFKNQVCSHLPSYMDCTNKLSIIVTAYADFSSVATPSCVTGGNLSSGSFAPGTANQVVLVSACYQWDFGASFANWTKLGVTGGLQLGSTAGFTNGASLIKGSTVFMTEPYS